LTGSLNVIKFGLITPIAGIPTVYYERSFGGAFSLEAGLGFMLPYAKGDGLSLIEQVVSGGKSAGAFQGVKSGFSWEIQPKLWTKTKRDRVEAGLGALYRNRTYNFESGRILNHADICAMVDYRYAFLPSHIVIGLNFGGGFRIVKDSNNLLSSSPNTTSLSFAFPGNIKVGYVF
jgi:hypothetical protein